MIEICVGTDPGKSGHTVWIARETGEWIGDRAQPLIGKGKGQTYDRTSMAGLACELQGEYRISSWAIEHQQAMGKGKGAQATFTQGFCYGLWIGIFHALEIPYTEIRPQEWRAMFGAKQPRYPKTKEPPKKNKEWAAWNKANNARIAKQRAEGLAAAILAAQSKWPGRDLRRTERCMNPSPDKAVAALLALCGRIKWAS